MDYVDYFSVHPLSKQGQRTLERRLGEKSKQELQLDIDFEMKEIQRHMMVLLAGGIRKLFTAELPDLVGFKSQCFLLREIGASGAGLGDRIRFEMAVAYALAKEMVGSKTSIACLHKYLEEHNATLEKLGYLQETARDDS